MSCCASANMVVETFIVGLSVEYLTKNPVILLVQRFRRSLLLKNAFSSSDKLLRPTEQLIMWTFNPSGSGARCNSLL